jgi:AcrR family transcriptional regulator
MAEIAHELGVSQGNLYNYVESKDALFHLVLQFTLLSGGLVALLVVLAVNVGRRN